MSESILVIHMMRFCKVYHLNRIIINVQKLKI